MLAYVGRRLSLSVPTLLIITLITFAMVRLLPGDPAAARLGDAWTASSAAEINSQLGLDRPWFVQYGDWMVHALQGDFGKSTTGGEAITPVLMKRMKVTVVVGAYALLFAIFLGTPIGVISATRQYSLADYVLRTVAILGLSVPGFFFATLLLAYRPFGWVPPLGRYVDPWQNPLGNFELVVFPSIFLGLSIAATIMRFTRTMMLEVLRQDYIRTARAKGLTEYSVIMRHALRNAMIPVVTVLGVAVTGVFGGSVIYESIFAIPGVGSYLLQSATVRDYPALQAITFVLALIVLLVNLGVDISYAVIDPRFKY